MKAKSFNKQVRRRVWTFTVISFLLTCGALKAEENFVRNGDFEQSQGNKLTGWSYKGNVKPKAVKTGWIRKTLKFNSREYKRTDIFFYGKQGCMGTIWIDNYTCSNIKIKNASFEQTDSNNRPVSWQGDYKEDVHTGNIALFSDSTKASKGKKSVRLTFENEAVQTTRIWQNVKLKPNQDYEVSYDVLIGDGFQGDVYAAAYSGAAHITANYSDTNITDILENRQRCGKYFIILKATKIMPAEISKDIQVESNMNLQACIDIYNKGFKGIVSFIIEDAVSGEILKKMDIKDVKDKWQTLQMRFQSKSSKVGIRLSASGEGILRADNIVVTFPQIIPPIQEAKWLSASENFIIPSQLKVSVQGASGKAIEGGLKLLEKDLKKFGVVLEKTTHKNSSLKILINAKYEIKEKGDESYSLIVNKKGITIKAKKEAGAFYGLMSILQLIEQVENKAVVLACDVIDYPDMPMRCLGYSEAEQGARFKMNTYEESTGYNLKYIHDQAQKCQYLNMEYIPHILMLSSANYIWQRNPNLVAGIWIQDEELTLNKFEITYLKNPYVIRTKLSDIKITGKNKNIVYTEGIDYKISNGDISFPYTNPEKVPNLKYFGVARIKGTKIPDGAEVLASYDYVDRYRTSTRRSEHPPYNPVEPEVRKLMADFITDLFRQTPSIKHVMIGDIHEFRPAAAMLETDSRVIKSGKSPIALYVEDLAFLHQIIKISASRTGAKAIVESGALSVYERYAGSNLPKDMIISIWNYTSGWAGGGGIKAFKFWEKHGFEYSGVTWWNLRNIWGWAQLVAKARAKGYNCTGLTHMAWTSASREKCALGLKETAIVSWRIPKKGEKRYIEIPDL